MGVGSTQEDDCRLRQELAFEHEVVPQFLATKQGEIKKTLDSSPFAAFLYPFFKHDMHMFTLFLALIWICYVLIKPFNRLARFEDDSCICIAVYMTKFSS